MPSALDLINLTTITPTIGLIPQQVLTVNINVGRKKWPDVIDRVTIGPT